MRTCFSREKMRISEKIIFRPSVAELWNTVDVAVFFIYFAIQKCIILNMFNQVFIVNLVKSNTTYKNIITTLHTAIFIHTTNFPPCSSPRDDYVVSKPGFHWQETHFLLQASLARCRGLVSVYCGAHFLNACLVIRN